MSQLSHPNVMSVVGVCLSTTQGPSIVMPYMANGSLLDYLKRERKNLYLEFDADTDTVSTHTTLRLVRPYMHVSMASKKNYHWCTKHNFK